MRIVYFIEDIGESGGVERIITQKANALAQDFGHEVTIVSAYETNGPLRYEVDGRVRLVSLNIRRARHTGLFIAAWDKARIFTQCIKRLRRTLKELQPDVTFYVWVLGAMALPFTKGSGRRIFESHLSRHATPYKMFLRWMERSADCVVTLTHGDAREFHRCHNVQVIPNFISLPERSVSDYTIRRAIAVGRLMPVKGFDRLIRIWQQVIAEHPDWQLDIFGIGPLHDNLQQQIDTCGLTEKVHLCGRTENMTDEYTRHSIHVMTSHAEGQPMTLLEAQACGLPSVVFDFHYGARDLVNDGKNGRLVKQDDEDAFAHALKELMASDDERRRMGGEAKVRAHAYTIDKVMPLWEKLLAEQA